MDIYEKQKMANILAFLTDERFEKRRVCLERITRRLYGTGVTWSIAMSCALFFTGIVDDFHDIDILIDINDVKRFETIVESVEGFKIDHNTLQKDSFTSPYYKEAMLGTVHFDLIGDMTVNTFECSYCYKLKREHIECEPLGSGLMFPLAPVEANYLLYGMMVGWQPRRVFKRNLCYEFLKEREVRHRDILEDVNGKGDISEELYMGVQSLIS